MALGRPKVALILTDEERVRLDSLAHRSRTAPHLARRARIILACAEGTDSKVVARRLRVTAGTVCKWRGRFITDRLDGLYDEPRPGAKRTIHRSFRDPARADGSEDEVLAVFRSVRDEIRAFVESLPAILAGGVHHPGESGDMALQVGPLKTISVVPNKSFDLFLLQPIVPVHRVVFFKKIEQLSARITHYRK